MVKDTGAGKKKRGGGGLDFKSDPKQTKIARNRNSFHRGMNN